MMEVSNVSSYVDASQSSSSGQKLGKNEFFQILAAQLQFQDPMEGGDNSEYVAQLAQFSALEQMENLNLAIADLKNNQNLLFGSQMIGKTVEVVGENEIVKGEVQSVRVRESGLYIVVGDQEYVAEDILNMTLTPDEQVQQIIEGMEHIGQVLDQAFAPEPQVVI
ncbi:MAG: flagellar biosynthesis protein FlgD [Peptostreptococcaceae bacterium]|nr:flagellar biosynthesis protein FlgD [Peptostreptococcaceae bacterium]